jgi:hypothetical protein
MMSTFWTFWGGEGGEANLRMGLSSSGIMAEVCARFEQLLQKNSEEDKPKLKEFDGERWYVGCN